MSEEGPFGSRVRDLLGLTPRDPTPQDPGERWRQPGWTGLAELYYQSRLRIPSKRRRGRPRGSTWIRSPEAVRAAYRDAQADPTVRPTQEEVAHRLGRGVTTLKEYMTRKGMSWPPD